MGKIIRFCTLVFMYAVANVGCQECEGFKPTVTRSILKCHHVYGLLLLFFFPLVRQQNVRVELRGRKQLSLFSPDFSH